MKFSEAMEKLKNGAKVTRHLWGNNVYFLMDGNDVRSFQPKLTPYSYNEDIMISDGWLVDDKEEEMRFCDIIPCLQRGAKVSRKDWVEMYIYLDPVIKDLAVASMDSFPYAISFDSFVAEDWVEI